MREYNERIARLSPAKRADLERRLLKNSSPLLRQEEIRRKGTADSSVLSFAQERLWILDQLEPSKS